MVLDAQRDTMDPVISKIAEKFLKVSPDVLTWSALLFSIIAGVFFYLSSEAMELVNYYLFIAAFFVFLNGLFDAIDGKVAKATGKASLRGDFLDHALDRYADVCMVGGLALSAWCSRPSIGLLAMIGMLLTSYMGTQSQAVGHTRTYSGFLGRADRLVMLMIAPIIQHLLIRYSLELPWNITLLEWVLIYFAIVGNITAIQRFIGTLRWFAQQKQ